jgi:tetrahydromethanopterin S-methyltransferase subunit C
MQNRSEQLKDRPVAELLRQLSQETATLVRQELDLAKAEIAEKGRTAGLGAGLFGAAGVLGLAALGAFTAFLILLISLFLPAWASALIVAVVYGSIAAFLGLRGRDKVKQATPVVPEQTIETVKEDVQWAKTQTRSDRT